MVKNVVDWTMKHTEEIELYEELRYGGLGEPAVSDGASAAPRRPAAGRMVASRLRLRDVRSDDVAVFFEQQRDPAAHRLAAFTAGAPDDRAGFDAHWARLLADDDTRCQTVVVDAAVAGHVLCLQQLGQLEVGYWIGPAFRGRGVATRALALLLILVAQRPLHARVARGHAASRRVLEKNGFRLCGADRGYAAALGAQVETDLFELGPTTPLRRRAVRLG